MAADPLGDTAGVAALKSEHRVRMPKKGKRLKYDLTSDRCARGAVLAKLGFRTYREYLLSDLWKKIRSRAFRLSMECAGCGGRATQMHHTKYTEEVLLGKEMKEIVPICGDCHKKIEYGKKGSKLPVKAANRKLMAMISRRINNGIQ